MATTTPNSGTEAANRSISDIQSQTDTFEVISKNKAIIIAVIALIVIAVLGWGYFQTHRHESNQKLASKVYTFSSTTLKDYQDKKIQGDVLKSEFLKLSSEVKSFEGLNVVAFSVTDLLLNEGKTQDAYDVLNTVNANVKNDYAKLVFLTRKAVIEEDLGKLDDAIKSLEQLASLPVKVFEGKTYLDLGRLYLKKGDKEKAKKNFEYVVNTAKEEVEFVKIANLYLGQM
jgi:predicted negative regulator of RcsB-dependent stress response